MKKNTDINFSESIIEKLIKSSLKHPKRPAIKVDGLKYTYEQLFSYAKNIAVRLKYYNDNVCVILSERNLIAYVSLLAVLLSGKAYIFLDPKDSVEKKKSTISKVHSSLLIVDNKNAGFAHEIKKLFDTSLKTLILGKQQLTRSDVKFHPPKMVYKYAYMMTTSGSTGNPKIIPITHSNLDAYLKNIIEISNPNSYDHFSQITELTFDFSVHDIFTCWSVGACLHVLPDNYIMGIPNYIHNNKITFWASVPSTINLLNQLNKLTSIFSSIRHSFFCGETLTTKTAQCWKKYAPYSIIDNLYGPTETTVAISQYRYHSDLSQDIVPIGHPFPDQTMILFNDNKKVTREGEVGEIHLMGSQVAEGYWNNEPLTNEKFITFSNNNIAYKTGDLAYYHQKLGYILRGRTDDQLKLRGYRIEKIEIESIIKKIACTDTLAIIPIRKNPHENVSELICFFSHSPYSPSQLISRCRTHMRDYMIPTRFVQLDSLPYNKNGKINYLALKKRDHNMKTQHFYQQQSMITDPKKYANYFLDLPKDIQSIKEIIQHLIMHFWDTQLLGYEIPRNRLPEIELRYVSNMLKKIIELDDCSLLHYRALDKRIIGSCRDFAVLFCAILRFHGIPARTRVAFSTFYYQDVYHDEMVVEYWSDTKNRWCLADPRVTEPHIRKQKLKIDFDLLDVPSDKLMIPAHAWTISRSQPHLANKFCGGNKNRNRGLWYIRDRLIQDIACLNKVEMQLWDTWGLMLASHDIENDHAQLNFIDELAFLSLQPDKNFDLLRSLYKSSNKCRVGSSVISFGPIYAGQRVRLSNEISSLV